MAKQWQDAQAFRMEVLALLVQEVEGFAERHPETYKRLMEYRPPCLDD